jgi:hypothetical protein
MSVSTTHLPGPAASTTSSGFADGLGRRVLAFDREEGTMLERLVVRPELAAFEAILRERVERVAALEDERIARPRTVERDGDGALVVVSEFVPGSRLSELLDTAAEQGTAPGVDAAFGFWLDVLPALCGLHAGAGFAHGAITPSRIILTPAGQVVLLDGVYGGALAHLRYGQQRLWREFGVAVPATPAASRLDVETDIAQAVLAGVMLIVGRPLYLDEFPLALDRVLRDVIEVAQIRGSADFASGFQTFLERALPIPASQPYASADDALIDLRDLARELGIPECRRAFVDFIQQMYPPDDETGSDQPIEDDEQGIDDLGELAVSLQDSGESVIESAIEVDDLVEEPLYDLGSLTDFDTPLHRTIAPTERISPETPVHVEPATAAAIGPGPAPPAEILPPPRNLAEPIPLVHLRPEEIAAPDARAEFETESSADADASEAQPGVRLRRAKRIRSARARKDRLRSAATPNALITQKADPHEEVAPPIALRKVSEIEPEGEPAIDVKPEAKPGPKPEVQREDPKTDSTWLVAPGRAAAFEPPVPDMVMPAPAPAPTFAASPPLPPQVMPPVPAPQFPAVMTAPTTVPQYPPVAMQPVPIQQYPPFAPPPRPTPQYPPPPANPTFAQPPAVWSSAESQSESGLPQLATVRLKQPAVRARVVRPSAPLPDIYGPAPARVQDAPSAFPWKLAAAGLAAMAVLIVGGRLYLGGSSGSESAGPASSTAATAAAGASSAAATTEAGRLEIETQPAGARILLDGKPAGESPLTLEAVPAGRHTVTFVTASGAVKRTVRIEAGRTAKLDVPIFSGWVGIFAPFVVEVAEGGKVIGTTEESRLMLSPGRHELTLTNRELGYRSVQSVDIEPGEVRSLTLDPRGAVNVNAKPWAEVWVDGRKAGDTPLANLQLPLGTRELVLRHPQYGERRVTVTVKGNAPTALSIDMDRP